MSAHARFAPSSSGRLIACPASLVLSEREVSAADADTSNNFYAAEGTLAHWVLSSVLSGSMTLVEFRNLVKNSSAPADGVPGTVFRDPWAGSQYTPETIAKTRLSREMVNVICVAVDFVLNEAQDVLQQVGALKSTFEFRFADIDKRADNDPFADLWDKAKDVLMFLRRDGVLLVEQRVVANYLMTLRGNPCAPTSLGFGEFKGTADILLNFTKYADAAVLPYLIGCFDLKYGAGVDVSARGNAQLLYYLSASVSSILSNLTHNSAPRYAGHMLKLGIIQPRTSPNYPVKIDTLTVMDLWLWQAEKLLNGAQRARDAWDTYEDAMREWQPVSADATKNQEARNNFLADRLLPYLTAGTHCRFCPAAASCPGLSALALDVARSQFGAYVDPMGVVPTPPARQAFTPVPNSVADFLP